MVPFGLDEDIDGLRQICEFCSDVRFTDWIHIVVRRTLPSSH